MTQKIFDLDLLDLPELERVTLPSGRTYVTPEGNSYPSVTTVLGTMADKSGLDDWVARVGEREAKRISTYSANRGTQVHELCEKLVYNQPVSTVGMMPLPKSLYNQFERKLVKHVNHIRGSETYLYSDKLKIAGSTDLIASWDGIPSIIDFKTSGKPKKKEWISGYFHQCALYSYMLWERTGLRHNQLVVIIGVEHSLEAQVFIDDVRNWIPEASKICKDFHKKFT